MHSCRVYSACYEKNWQGHKTSMMLTMMTTTMNRFDDDFDGNEVDVDHDDGDATTTLHSTLTPTAYPSLLQGLGLGFDLIAAWWYRAGTGARLGGSSRRYCP